MNAYIAKLRDILMQNGIQRAILLAEYRFKQSKTENDEFSRRLSFRCFLLINIAIPRNDTFHKLKV